MFIEGEKKTLRDLLWNWKNIALDSHIFHIESPIFPILPFFSLLLFSLSLSLYGWVIWNIYTIYSFLNFAKYLRVNYRDSNPKPLNTLHVSPKKKDILLHNHNSKIKIWAINIVLTANCPNTTFFFFFSSVDLPTVQDPSHHHAWHLDDKLRDFCWVLELCGT